MGKSEPNPKPRRGAGRRRSDAAKFFLASIVESLEDSVVSVDFDSVITSWNKGAERLYGYSAGEVIGKPLTVLTLPEDLAQVMSNIEVIKRGGFVRVYESERVHKDGRRLHLLITLSPLKDEAGRIVGVSTVARDITGRRRSEGALRESESRLGSALAVARLGAFEWDVRTGAVALDDRSREIFGFAEGEGVHVQEVFDRIHPADFPRAYAETQASLRGLSRLETEYRVVLPDGAVRTVVSISEAAVGADGLAERMFGVFGDITERKREERDRQFLLELGEKIRLGGSKPEELLDEVLRATGEHLGAARCLFVEIDEAGNRGTVKHEFRREGLPPVPGEYKISDYSPETLEEIKTGRAVVNHDAEHDPRTAATFGTAYEPYGERSYVSVPLFTDGRWRAIFWVSDDRARRWAPQEVTLLEGVAERAWLAAEKLRNEADLRESEERLRALVSQATAGITQNDRAGKFMFVNDRYCEIVGYTREELLQMRMQDITDPEILPANAELYERVWRDGTPFVIEKQYIRKDGSRVWANNNVAPVLGAGGKTEAVVCVSIDVTERVRAEEDLKRVQAETDRQRRLYDTILSSTPDLVYVFDLDHRFTFANDELLRMWGRSWDEAIGKNCLELGYPDWHAEMHDRELEQVKATKRPVRGVVPFEGTFGRRLYDYIFVPIIGADGEVEAVAGTTRDVTELKEAEENLRQSRETLSLAMSGSRMGAWSRNLLKDEVYWSPELEAIFGLPEGSFSGKIADYYDLVHPEDRERLRREVWEAIDGRRSYVIEFRYRHADGSVRWMEGRGHAIYSAEGQPTQVFGIGIDVTERKRAALNAEFLADVGDDFARVTTPDEVVRAVGERLNRLLNTSTCAFVEVSESADTATIEYEWHREDVPSLVGVYSLPEFVTAEFLQAAKSGETLVVRDVNADDRIADPRPWSELKIGAHIHVPLIRRGEWRFSLCVYQTEAYDWRDDEVNLMRELASRVWARLERAFAEQEREGLLKREHAARLQAEEAGRLKDEFLATVSHELRTPLTAILGWAQMLRTRQLDAEGAARALETIERNARSQAQLVEDLLDVSRIITGNLRLDFRHVDPRSFIAAAVDTLAPAAEAKGVRVQQVLDAGVLAVSGDPSRLQQVVWNLLSNAVKFTPRGGRVQVRLERVDSHVEIVVADTGAGIAPEFLPHVFDRFRQADQTTTRSHGGLGLGLAIVRHIVELHGGAVRAESEGEGKGATLTVSLPLGPVYQTEGPGERRRPTAADQLPARDCPEGLVGLRVLIVDDEPDTLELLKLGLERCGAEVATAGSVAEALDALRDEAFGLLISDIGMPAQDGYALIAEVRKLPAAKGGKVPAIALTAYTRTEDRLRALRAGYQMHVTKPVELAELVAVAAVLTRGDG